MEIKAQDVKALRDKTGAGMMECKKALEQAQGDATKAEKLLKEKGLAAVEKRATRATTEGRIFIKTTDKVLALLELTCETDFVAKNADFVALGQKMLELIIQDNILQVNDTLKALLTELATKIRENMNIGRIALINIPQNAAVASYVHSDFKSGAVVVIKGSTSDLVKQFAKDCCLHLAAFTPQYLTQKSVPQSYIDEQKDIFQKQMEQDPKMSAKPDNVKQGILQGKIKKHLAEICFEDQMFVKDDKVSVLAKLKEIAKQDATTLEFGDIKLFVLGQ